MRPHRVGTGASRIPPKILWGKTKQNKKLQFCHLQPSVCPLSSCSFGTTTSRCCSCLVSRIYCVSFSGCALIRDQSLMCYLQKGVWVGSRTWTKLIIIALCHPRPAGSGSAPPALSSGVCDLFPPPRLEPASKLEEKTWGLPSPCLGAAPASRGAF